MAWTDRFQIGPLGAMVDLPAVHVASGVDALYEQVVSEQTSLRGATTRDIWAVKRSWSWSWPRLDEDTADQLATWWLGLVPGLRLVDPLVRNLLSIQAASGGSLLQTADGFTASAGTPAWDDVPPTALVGRVAGSVLWEPPNSAVQTLLVDSGLRLPYLAGPVTARVLATGSGTANVFLRPYDASGSAGSDVHGSSVTLSGSWQELTVSDTPGGSDVSALLGVRFSSGSSRSIRVGALQAEHGDEVGDWSPGGSCPAIHVTGFTQHYTALGKRAVDLAVREI